MSWRKASRVLSSSLTSWECSQPRNALPPAPPFAIPLSSRLTAPEQLTIQKGTKIRLKIVGTRIDATEIVSGPRFSAHTPQLSLTCSPPPSLRSEPSRRTTSARLARYLPSLDFVDVSTSPMLYHHPPSTGSQTAENERGLPGWKFTRRAPEI